MKTKIILINYLFFVSSLCLAQGNTIAASFDNFDCNERVLRLYKYNSPFSIDLIDTQKGINGMFAFRRTDGEVNTYLLEYIESKSSLLFIWDNDLIIDLKCNKISESVVRNSAQTEELNRINALKYNLYILPLLKMNSLIVACNSELKDVKQIDCKELALKRDLFASSSQRRHNEFIIDYVKRNPDSFVSLYYLTYGGDEIPPETEYVEIFKILSERLKSHSRSQIYRNP